MVVLFQFYLVFPFLLKLLKSTSTRQHVLIMSISIAIALFIGTDLHYNPDIGVVGHYVHDIGSKWVWSRNLISYQVYFVAGALVAFHFEAVFDFVRRWSRWILLRYGRRGRGDDALVRHRYRAGRDRPLRLRTSTSRSRWPGPSPR